MYNYDPMKPEGSEGWSVLSGTMILLPATAAAPSPPPSTPYEFVFLQ